MSTNELLEKVKALPLRERRKFLERVHELEESLLTPTPRSKKRAVQWPDAEERRRRIFGEKILPNLVLLARSEERF